jgi:hypothetical protein
MHLSITTIFWHQFNFSQGTCLFIILVFIFGVVLLSINISIPFWFTSNNSDNPDEYSLTDMIIIPYTKFCSSLEIKSKDSVQSEISDSTANLYLLNSSPSLSGHQNFTHEHNVFFIKSGKDTQEWSLNMHPGSTFSFEVCYTPTKGTAMTRDVVYYLIQGDENYNNWIDDPNDSYSVQHIRLSTRCRRITYQVEKDDIYYFVFYNDNMDGRSILNVRFRFNRTKYEFTIDDIVDSCSIGVNSHDSCSVNLPLLSSYTALLELETNPPIDWDDGVIINIQCQPRGWLYAVIVLSVVLFLVGIVVTVTVTCLCVYLKKRRGRRKAYMAINSEPTISIDRYGRPPIWWYTRSPRTLSKIPEE